MMQLLNERILENKNKLKNEEGFFSLVYIDGKFVEFLKANKTYPKDAKIVLIPSTKFNILWGTREKLTYKVQDEFVHIGLSGNIELEIINPRKFYNDVLATNKKLAENDLQATITPVIVSQLDIFSKDYIKKNMLNIIDLETFKSQMGREFRLCIDEKLQSLFGLNCKGFALSRVLFEDEEFEKIKKQNELMLQRIQQQAIQKRKEQALEKNKEIQEKKTEQNKSQEAEKQKEQEKIQEKLQEKDNTQETEQNYQKNNEGKEAEMLLE